MDDRLALMGSSDWTSRGFSGDKNSEVCLRITDRNTSSLLCGGSEVTVGNFPHQLRVERMRDHMGGLHHGAITHILRMRFNSPQMCLMLYSRRLLGTKSL